MFSVNLILKWIVLCEICLLIKIFLGGLILFYIYIWGKRLFLCIFIVLGNWLVGLFV